MKNEIHRRKWISKFENAFRGVGLGIRGQSSFLVHLPVAIVVIALALFLQLDAIRFGILLVCIAVVISAELFNSSIERLARAVVQQHDPAVGEALDIASGAVLCAAILSAVVGVMILLPPLLQLVSGN